MLILTCVRSLICFTSLTHSIFFYKCFLKNLSKLAPIHQKEMEKYPSSATIGPTVSLFSPKTWAGRQRFCPDNSFLSYSMILSCNCKPHSASSEHLQHKLLAYIHSMNNLIIMSSIEWNCKTKIMWMWYNDFKVNHLRWWQELVYSTLLVNNNK